MAIKKDQAKTLNIKIIKAQNYLAVIKIKIVNKIHLINKKMKAIHNKIFKVFHAVYLI